MPKAIKTPVKKTTTRQSKAVGLSVPLYSLDGKESGRLELSKELFGVEVNKALLSQAARVYLTNQKSHNAHTKTRGEVQGSSRKIKPQKEQGTRHGNIRAPIFVGGGIALGPKSRKTILDLPQKMKRAALVSALSDKHSQGEVMGVDLDKASGKTSQLAKLLRLLNKRSVLIILNSENNLVKRATKNLTGVVTTTINQLNALEVLKHQTLVLSKDFPASLDTNLNSSEKSRKESIA